MPPVHFTQATIQLLDGDGSQLFGKTHMGCVPTGGETLMGILHQAYIPKNEVLSRARAFLGSL